jgi:hypothetical protein
MSAVVFAIALAAVSDCGVERVETDPAWLSGKRCFNWTDLEGDIAVCRFRGDADPNRGLREEMRLNA